MRTESVYLDAVSADGSTAFVVRLQRNVGLGTAWVWVHAFVDGQTIGTVDEAVPCGDDLTDVGSGHCRYTTLDERVVFERRGTGGGMTGRLVVEQGRVAIEATFAPSLLAGDEGLLAGRTERHGPVTSQMTIDGSSLRLDALGQWHEQHQDSPRFMAPFTYLTIRGEEVSMVGLVAPRGSGALLGGPDGAARLDSLDAGTPGDRRSIAAPGHTGDLRTTYAYELLIRGHPRTSAIVVGSLDGRPVSGCVNDWTPPQS